MKNIKSLDTFNITGRGIVKLVNYPATDFVVDEVLEIDSVLYKIRGLECFRNTVGISKNTGLCVTKIKE